MSKVQIKDTKVVGPAHPAFGLSQAWYVFGMFSADQSVKRVLLVKAHNEHAVHMIESLVQQDGSVSDTCALISMSQQEPLTRSTALDQVAFWDFVLEIVDADRWMASPFLVSLFQDSLSEVQKAYVDRKMDEVMLRRQFAVQELELQLAEMQPAESCRLAEDSQRNDQLASQLQSGLANLGFNKRDVQKFVESVQDRDAPLQDLLLEGISQLNRGLS
jgi:hypothetical protein